MLKQKCDHKTRFRILKGGKVSMIVSALLVSASIGITDAKAAPVTINGSETTEQTLDGSTDSLTINGSVTISSGPDSTILLTGSLANGQSIINSGTLTVNGYGKAIRINNTNAGAITNNGTITSGGDGIWISDRNTGTITNNSGKSITATSNAIYIGESSSDGSTSSSGNIINNGTLTSLSNNAIRINSNLTGNFTNNGTITANQSGSSSDASGIYIDELDGTIENTGTITVDTTSESYGIKQFRYSGGGDRDSTGNINNSGTITATVNGNTDDDGYSIYILPDYGNHDITVTNSSSGTLNGNILVSEGTVNNSGKINLPYNANDGDAANIKTFTNKASGELQIALLTDGTTTTHSQLITTDATFENGSTIDVNVLSSSTNVELLEGTTLNDVVVTSESGGSLTINGTLNVTDNSTLLDFEYVKDGHTIDLNAVEASTIFDSTVSGGGNTSAKRNAQLLENFKKTSTGMNAFITELNKCSTDECVAKAVDDLEVKLAGAGVGAAKQTAQAIAKIVRQRQPGFGSGANSGDEMFTEKNFWLKPFGTWGKQDDKDDLSGYDVDTYGLGFGIDGTNKDDIQYGLAFFYTNADVSVNNANQSSDIDGFTLMGYGSMPVIDADTKLLYQLGYSWQKTDTFRETLTGNAKADYTSEVANIDVKLMRDYQVSDKWLLQPTVGLSYTYFTAPSYSESGAGAAGLDVEGFSTSEFLLDIGTVANYKIDNESKLITTLDINYDMKNEDDKITSTTQGGLQLADADSIDNGQVGYALGLGYERELTSNSNFNLTYEYSGQGSTYSSNAISFKYVLSF